MAVGLPAKTTYADGDVFSASDINDTNGTLNLVGQTNNFYAGKNKIINGDFSVNQRAFTSTTTTATFGFDRWVLSATDGTTTYSAQTFTLGTAPVAGYEGTNFARLVSTGQTATNALSALNQPIENVRTFAGQTITVSFWAKAASGTPNITVFGLQNFGASGSSPVFIAANNKQAISTSWVRYSFQLVIPSIAGKTIAGGGDLLRLYVTTSAGSDRNSYTNSLGIQSATIDIWGVQAEAGTVATAFQTATGTLQGELAACQRYYLKSYNTDVAPATNSSVGGVVWNISPNVANNAYVGSVRFPVTMRTAPTVTVYSYTSSNTSRVSDMSGADLAANSGVVLNIGNNGFPVQNQSGGTINTLIGGFIFHYVASAEL
jgi:hypothetical protein